MTDRTSRFDPLEPATRPLATSSDGDYVETVRSEEQLAVTTSWAPYRRVVVGKRVVTETRNVPVEVRHEELLYGDQPMTGAPSRDVPTTGRDPVEFTLYEERIVITRVIVPVERVRVSIEAVPGAVQISAALAREHIAFE